MANRVLLKDFARVVGKSGEFNPDPLEITENGSYNVEDYAEVNVNVEGGETTPVGEMTLTDNITWDNFTTYYSELVDRGVLSDDVIYTIEL